MEDREAVLRKAKLLAQGGLGNCIHWMESGNVNARRNAGGTESQGGHRRRGIHRLGEHVERRQETKTRVQARDWRGWSPMTASLA